jgi:ribosomal-protein-alanine N-acetyltransferase
MTIPFPIKTERLVIRRFEMADEANLIVFATTDLVTKNLAFPDNIKNREGALSILHQTINAYDTEGSSMALAITKVDDIFIGACGMGYIEPEVMEVFYALLPDYWGYGFATEVLSILKEYIIVNFTAKEIHAPIKTQNNASKRVAEKNGFKFNGMIMKEHFSEPVCDYLFLIDGKLRENGDL